MAEKNQARSLVRVHCAGVKWYAVKRAEWGACAREVHEIRIKVSITNIAVPIGVPYSPVD